MPDAGPLDPRCELTADLLGELGRDPVAEEGGDVFGFDSEDGLPGKLLIERFEDGWRAEHQIRGVLNLHETPMVGLSEHVEHRTALLGVPIEDATQHVGREAMGKGLRALPVVDAQEGVVGKGETDPGGSELTGQPAMPVAIELEAERTPCRHAQIDQAQFGVDEVEVVVQAFAGIRPQEGAMRLFVVPGLVGVAGFHGRDDMDQAGMVAAHGKYLGDDVFLANVLLGNVFDGDASRTGQFGSAVAHAITKRFGKSRIVEDPDLPRRKNPHHPFRIAGPGQRAGDDDPVVAGEHPGEALAVTLRQQLPQPPLPLPALLRLYYPVWFRLRRLRKTPTGAGSLNKAVHVIGKSGPTYNLITGRTGIINAWNTHRSVAHLGIALLVSGENVFGGSPRRLARFLAIGRDYQRFATTYPVPHHHGVLIDPAEIWSVPEGLSLPDPPGLGSLPDDMLRALSTYRAPQ